MLSHCFLELMSELVKPASRQPRVSDELHFHMVLLTECPFEAAQALVLKLSEELHWKLSLALRHGIVALYV